MKKTVIAALLLGSGFAMSAQQTTLYSQDFEGPYQDIFDDGWDVIDFSGDSPEGGIFNSSPQIVAKGFTGQTMGLMTFTSDNGAMVNHPNTDSGMKTEDYDLPEGVSSISYKIGSVGFTGGAKSNYSVYIMAAEEYNGLATPAQLGAYLDAKTPAATGNINGNATTETLSLTAYAEKTVSLIFRLHDSLGNTFLLIDDVTVVSGVLASDGFTSAQFAVYPNPATNVLNIEAPQGALINNVTIADMNGRIIAQNTFDSLAAATVDIGRFTAGTYIMSVSSDKGIITKKIVKQ